MAVETFNLQDTAVLNAAANGSAGVQLWPTNPPAADPVSGGTLKLWQFVKGAWGKAEIFQAASHTVLTHVDGSMRVEWGDYAATLRSATGFNGLLMDAEVANQTHFVCFKNKDYAGNVAFLGNS